MFENHTIVSTHTYVRPTSPNSKGESTTFRTSATSHTVNTLTATKHNIKTPTKQDPNIGVSAESAPPYEETPKRQIRFQKDRPAYKNRAHSKAHADTLNQVYSRQRPGLTKSTTQSRVFQSRRSSVSAVLSSVPVSAIREFSQAHDSALDKKRCKNIFWVIVFLVCASGLGFFVQLRVIDFMTSGVMTSVSNERHKEQVFPRVTAGLK